MNPAVHGPFAFERKNLVGLAGNRLGHQARAEAAGTHADGAHFAIGKLVADILQVGVEAAVIFDVGMAHMVPRLGMLAADVTLLGHDDILHIFGLLPET